jgi:hypothetical protein
MFSDLAMRPRKQILLNFFLGLSGRCRHPRPKQAAAPPPPPQIFIHPREQKYENPSLGEQFRTSRAIQYK